jgi:hypothetical protein
MSYVMLIVEPIEQRGQRTLAEGQAAYNSMLGYAEKLKARGVLKSAESLLAQDRAVRVQKRAGEKRLVDGPFAEAKEMIGGFFLLDVKTRDEAVAIAADCPAAEWCTIEVRELGPCFA